MYLLIKKVEHKFTSILTSNGTRHSSVLCIFKFLNLHLRICFIEIDCVVVLYNVMICKLFGKLLMQTMIVTRFYNQIKKPDANHDYYQINKCMGMNNQSSAMRVPEITEEDSKSTRVELNCTK